MRLHGDGHKASLMESWMTFCLSSAPLKSTGAASPHTPLVCVCCCSERGSMDPFQDPRGLKTHVGRDSVPEGADGVVLAVGPSRAAGRERFCNDRHGVNTLLLSLLFFCISMQQNRNWHKIHQCFFQNKTDENASDSYVPFLFIWSLMICCCALT